MKHKRTIGILGDGRIARAVASYLNGFRGYRAVSLAADRDARACDLIIGALPGELGERGLRLALRYQKNLIDVSDIDPPFYLRRRKEIEAAGITVMPGCGFSPGLVNGILGHELRVPGKVRGIEIMAGSLSPKKHFYPFLWCFEDLILEHRIPSRQVVDGVKRKFPPFAGYRDETFSGIAAESYYCASGFENVLDKYDVRTLVTRVVRPRGFREFFLFMRNYGFFDPSRMAQSKTALEAVKADNLTLAELAFDAGPARVVWELRSASSAGERLNSMQKITASVPALTARYLCEGDLPLRGLVFMEELGARETFFGRFIAELKPMGVSIRRSAKKGAPHD